MVRRVAESREEQCSRAATVSARLAGSCCRNADEWQNVGQPRARTMHRQMSFVVGIGVALLVQLEAVSSPVPRKAAESAATKFCQAVVSPGGFSYWGFEGKTRERMKPLLSKRLLAHLDNIHACVRDWARHQPPNSTNKPPGVDCCVFSASADWTPTSFFLRSSDPLPDGRRRVVIEYRFDSPHEHARWHVAVYVVKEDLRYVVDDFEGGLDDQESDRWLVVGDDPRCKDGKWMAPN